MGAPAYNLTVKSSGTSTAMTDEATTHLGNNVYQITDAAKRTLDRDVVPTIEENGVAATTEHTIDYVFGLISFEEDPVLPITVATGNYLPLTRIAGGHDASLSLSNVMLDRTEYSSTGVRKRQAGLFDASISVTRYDDLLKTFKTLLATRNALFLSYDPDGSNSEVYAGWFKPVSTNNQGGVEGIEEEILEWSLDGNGAGKDFSFIEP